MLPLINDQAPINYDSPVLLKTFLDTEGLGMRKQFGQNFLINPAVRARLLDALELCPNDDVWEIGPGLGAMTQGLLDRGAMVRAFEIDPGFIRILQRFFGTNPRFSLVAGDALKTWRHIEGGFYLLGNLPYNIGARLLATFIEENRLFKRIVVTVQREVAQRMTARPFSKDYSSFSVLCASAYTITPLMVLKGSSFYPAPHVDSQGVRLDLRTDIDPRSYPVFFRPLVRHLFAARRKTIKNNLQNFVSSYILNTNLTEQAPHTQDIRDNEKGVAAITMKALDMCTIDKDKRAETLGLEDFVALAKALEDTGGYNGNH